MNGNHQPLHGESAFSFGPFQLSGDLSVIAQAGVGLLVLATILLLWVETSRQSRRRPWVFLTGVLGVLALALAVLRPSELRVQGQKVPGLALALVDSSHRLNLRGDETQTRRQVALHAVEALRRSWPDARVEQREFGPGVLQVGQSPGFSRQSDLLSTLRQISGQGSERPNAIVLFSDGRLTRPGAEQDPEWAKTLQDAARGIPIHTVGVAPKTPRDRSIRSVGFTGTAVAHQPLSLQLEVGCEPHDSCAEIEVVVRELLEGQEPVELVRGKTQGKDGLARLSLSITLERAGGRVIEIELLGTEEDEVPENDKRIIPVLVRRDRLRMLHVAGRPTYDVRALRMFLKSDESIDLISFFILRTQSDDVGARQDELSLIPFPVEELFTDHLSSFDAVILQDIDATRYGLDSHFRAIKDYVLKGGGLILVGGPTSFSSGGYAGTPVADVLPVQLPLSGELIAKEPFVPQYTRVGRAAPMLRSLQLTMGEDLPTMSGANILGRPRENALVLWQHPSLLVEGAPGPIQMPVLALAEVGDGRSIAMSVDSTHQLRFGERGAQTGGRGYADLWEGLLGWLMRDPRYESAQLHLDDECIAGRDLILRVDILPRSGQEVKVVLERLGVVTSDARNLEPLDGGSDGASLRFLAREMEAGGYAARVTVGAAPPTRAVFACEVGGGPWADSRPDNQRLERIAKTTSGLSVFASGVAKLPQPSSTFVSAVRHSSPLLPPWVWAAIAAVLVSIHWIVRRAVGHV